MYLYPAIDIFGGKAVRLFKGDYAQMTVYNENPAQVAMDFRAAGCQRMHLVDLEGAREGRPVNLEVIRKLRTVFGGFVEVGGGIRNMETVRAYLAAGVDRVILGTAAVTDEAFLKEAIAEFGSRIAVGVDLKDGYVAIKGWTEKSELSAHEFFGKMQSLGVKTIICTDISRDGAMMGTNRELYRELAGKYSIDLIASGGVSDMADIEALAKLDIHGAIIGKAYYIGAIDLKKALEVAR